jgi:DNA-binding YbaB/EbfC family protein
MQERLKRELDDLQIEASVGGGMVTVKMNGAKQVTAVTIDPEVLDPKDPAMVQDLVLAAVNEAGRRVDEAVQSKLGGMTGGLPSFLR